MLNLTEAIIRGQVEVYTADGEIAFLTADEMLGEGEVLSGFTLAVRELFEI